MSATIRDNNLTDEELELVRNRLDSLELKTEEARKPWYRQLPLWISILSLLVSSGFSGYTAYAQAKEHRAEELKKRLENLRAIVLQIADIRNEFLLASTSPNQDMAQLAQRSSLLNTKKQVLIETADALISGIESEVSPAIYAELAYEESTDGKFAEAKHHYEQALQCKNLEQLTSFAILRSLGELYMQPATSIHDNDKGRAYYRQALQVIQDNQDDAALSSKTYLWADWAYSEFINGNIADGQKYLNQARAEAVKINPRNSAGLQQALNYVNIANRYSDPAAQSRSATSSGIGGARLAGQWRISYADDPSRTGIVSVISGPDPKSTTVNVDIFQSNNLVRKYSGPLYVPDDGLMQIEWSGVQSTPSPAMPWVYVYGITRLRPSKDGSIVGRESAVGDVTRVIRLQKTGR